MRTILLTVSVCLSFFIPQWSLAQSLLLKPQPQYQEGKHYQVLPQVFPTDNADTIEVREVFSYACPHCYQFQSVLEDWSLLDRDDIDYVPMPAIFNDGMRAHGQLYYTLKSMGMVEKLHPAVFDGIHKEKKKLNKEPAIRAFLVRLGVDEKAFNEMFNSKGVNEQVIRAASLTREYRITGTPALVIDGRYLINARAVGGHPGMLRATEQLIDQIRLERTYGAKK